MVMNEKFQVLFEKIYRTNHGWNLENYCFLWCSWMETEGVTRDAFCVMIGLHSAKSIVN
jgi:hypothetical protein